MRAICSIISFLGSLTTSLQVPLSHHFLLIWILFLRC